MTDTTYRITIGRTVEQLGVVEVVAPDRASAVAAAEKIYSDGPQIDWDDVEINNLDFEFEVKRLSNEGEEDDDDPR
jgi:hypothetical protein